MLSDAERRSLDEIEQRLAVEEPDLARAFAAGPERNAWMHHLVMLVFGALGMLLLAIGSPGIGVLCLVLVGATALLQRHPLRIR